MRFEVLGLAVLILAACTPQLTGQQGNDCPDRVGFVSTNEACDESEVNEGEPDGEPETVPAPACEQKACQRDNDCSDAEVCRVGFCHTACERDADCDQRELCREGFCKDQVNDCLSGESCSGQLLSGSDFQCTLFSSTTFTNADLSEANFGGAVLTESNFEDAKIERAIFSGASMVGADLTLTQAGECDFEGAVLIDVSFERADLENALFGGADLTGASFGSTTRL